MATSTFKNIVTQVVDGKPCLFWTKEVYDSKEIEVMPLKALTQGVHGPKVIADRTNPDARYVYESGHPLGATTRMGQTYAASPSALYAKLNEAVDKNGTEIVVVPVGGGVPYSITVNGALIDGAVQLSSGWKLSIVLPKTAWQSLYDKFMEVVTQAGIEFGMIGKPEFCNALERDHFLLFSKDEEVNKTIKDFAVSKIEAANKNKVLRANVTLTMKPRIKYLPATTVKSGVARVQLEADTWFVFFEAGCTPANLEDATYVCLAQKYFDVKGYKRQQNSIFGIVEAEPKTEVVVARRKAEVSSPYEPEAKKPCV